MVQAGARPPLSRRRAEHQRIFLRSADKKQPVRTSSACMKGHNHLLSGGVRIDKALSAWQPIAIMQGFAGSQQGRLILQLSVGSMQSSIIQLCTGQGAVRGPHGTLCRGLTQPSDVQAAAASHGRTAWATCRHTCCSTPPHTTAAAGASHCCTRLCSRCRCSSGQS